MIYGCYKYDLSNLSVAFNRLGISYTLIGENLNEVMTVNNQTPSNLYIVDGISRIRRITSQAPVCVIVCDAKSALLNTNCNRSLFHVHTEEALLDALKALYSDTSTFQLKVSEPTLDEIVDKVTTKSILTDIQTLVNKISPYDLRKKAHKYCIMYLYGTVSKMKLLHFFNSSHKLEKVKDILLSEGGSNLRNAVIEYKNVKDENIVAEKYGVHTFEILYTFNSFGKLEE